MYVFVHRADKIIIIIFIIIYMIEFSCSCQPDLVCFLHVFFFYSPSVTFGFLFTNLCVVLDILKEGGKQLYGGSQDLLRISLEGLVTKPLAAVNEFELNSR